MASSATVRVEKATSHLLMGPDWALNMEICDSINSDQWQAKDVIKAVKKRLQNKNPKVQFLSLTLLETLVKNCGDYVHFQVVDRDILEEMIKIVRKKTDMQVRDKILVLLDSWQEAFGGPGGKHPQYYWAYAELKRYGVVFPQRSANAPPIFTPPVTHLTSTSSHPQAGYNIPSNGAATFDETMTSEIGNLSLSDLNNIRSVMELLSDMLKAVNPYDRGAVRDEVITDLVSQSRTNQKRVMQLVSSTGDEKLLGLGLELYDKLQSLLMKHDAIASGSPLPPESSESISKSKMPVASTPVRNSQFEDEEEEDDDFAQLARRNSKFKPVATQSTFANTGDQEASPNRSDVTTVTAGSSASEASSFIASNALALLDPPPVRTVGKDQDMIDLLSLTLSTNPSSPHTPLTPPPTSSLNGSHSSSGHDYLQNPQPYSVNQGYNPYNGYVAPWAQHALPPAQAQPPFQPQPPSQPQPPFQPQSPSQPQPSFQPQPPAQAQFQNQPPLQAQLPFRPQSSAQTQFTQHSFSHPPPPWFFPAMPNPSPVPLTTYQSTSSHASSAAYAPDYSSRPLQRYDSFGGRVNNVPAMTGEKPVNANLRQTGAAAAPKPYYLPDRLFEDLIDLRNPSGGQKANRSSSLSGASSQPMISGRK
ncbi:TOM1-like protein 6 [Phoenix dactylifera]|uniref:TOM1-like protein 6 n=1 Tax=Phoenix dactylifera TaxID=42345 RepID=A0A8B9ACA5_PHODC|nr:TOM1-like protein 6 [Phoenix dactylifera]XP_038980849.1 TOM1-like protein 6 [Phoenix dactylifera]